MRRLFHMALLILLVLPPTEVPAQRREPSRTPRPVPGRDAHAGRSAVREQPRYLRDLVREPPPQSTQTPRQVSQQPRYLRDVKPESAPQTTQVPRQVPQQSRLRAPLTEPSRQDPARTPQDGYRTVFSNVQAGLASGDIGTISQHMGSQVYINLRGGESGYYSANQAYYVLDSYLKSRKLVNINFSTIGESNTRPYATGSAALVVRGNREIAQVYVSLSQVGEKWIITQINIY